MIVVDRKIEEEIRAKALHFTQPFLEAGLIEARMVAELSFNELRALLWQVRCRLPEDDLLRRAVIPRQRIPDILPLPWQTRDIE